MKQVLIIGASEDFSQFYFKSMDDFSFTPWVLDIDEKDYNCIHSTCLDYIEQNIFYSQLNIDIDNLYYVCTKNNFENNIYSDIFIYISNDFYDKISCDFLEYNDNTLDFEFNFINSWILAYIYNKFANQNIIYTF